MNLINCCVLMCIKSLQMSGSMSGSGVRCEHFKKCDNGTIVASKPLKGNRVVLSVPDVLHTESIKKWNEQYIPVGQFGYVYGIDSDVRETLNSIYVTCGSAGNVTMYYDSLMNTLMVVTLRDIDENELICTDHNIEHWYHKSGKPMSYLELS